MGKGRLFIVAVSSLLGSDKLSSLEKEKLRLHGSILIKL